MFPIFVVKQGYVAVITPFGKYRRIVRPFLAFSRVLHYVASMRSRLNLSLLVLVGVLAGSNAASAANAASPTVSSKVTFNVVSDPGLFLDAANPSAVVLPSGGVRLYARSNNGSASSWISTDGLHFTLEPGTRQPSGVQTGQVQIFTLANGSYRMYFGTEQNAADPGIGSATSTDGLNWTVDAGLRISVSQSGTGPSLTSGAVIELPNGTYRMYFSSLYQNPTGPAAVASNLIKSATSTDGLNWTMDPDVRMGAGAPYITSSSEHPSVLVNSDGSVTLFYGRRPTGPSDTSSGLYYSTSVDGLTFTSETRLIKQGQFGQLSRTPLDSALARLSDGTIALYRADRDDSTGHNYVKVLILSESIVPTTMAPPTFTLKVVVIGKGTVKGGSISCPGVCTASPKNGATVKLTAKAASGFKLSGWSGDCTGKRATCSVTLRANASVRAKFSKR